MSEEDLLYSWTVLILIELKSDSLPIPVIGISSSADNDCILFSEAYAIVLAICPEDGSVTSASANPVLLLASATVLKVNCVTSIKPTSAFAVKSGKVNDHTTCFFHAVNVTVVAAIVKSVWLAIELVHGVY